MVKTRKLENVYVLNYGSAVGPLEHQGPLSKGFDVYYEDHYCGEKSFEQAEQKLARTAINEALIKACIRIDDIDLIVGGDLMNQLMTSNYVARDFNSPFIGVYGACATSTLALIVLSSFLESKAISKGLAFTSSHFCNAEKQFRYPNEYGLQKKETTTTTATGAGSIILCSNKHDIKVSSYTIGTIVDWNQKNVNDMGSAMVCAAFDTITTHLKDLNLQCEDYDLILTGDLSDYGSKILKDMLVAEGYNVDNVSDCGIRLYDIEKQNVFCGGSGCACSILVLLSDVFKKLENHSYKKVLLVATGALLSPTAIFQKDSIPCVAHAVCFERM